MSLLTVCHFTHRKADRVWLGLVRNSSVLPTMRECQQVGHSGVLVDRNSPALEVRSARVPPQSMLPIRTFQKRAVSGYFRADHDIGLT